MEFISIFPNLSKDFSCSDLFSQARLHFFPSSSSLEILYIREDLQKDTDKARTMSPPNGKLLEKVRASAQALATLALISMTTGTGIRIS